MAREIDWSAEGHPAVEAEEHNRYCGCWMCHGREPDNSFLHYDLLRRWGPCAQCGDPLGPRDSTVHSECSSSFLQSISEDLPVAYVGRPQICPTCALINWMPRTNCFKCGEVLE